MQIVGIMEFLALVNFKAFIVGFVLGGMCAWWVMKYVYKYQSLEYQFKISQIEKQKQDMLIKYENEIKALQSQIQRLESGSSDINSSLQSEITLLQNANDMLNDRIESLLKSLNGKDREIKALTWKLYHKI